MAETARARRRGRKTRIAERRAPAPGDRRPVRPGLAGGRYRPLTERDIARIHETALDLLDKVGLADPIPSMVERVTAAGGRLDDRGRLRFPRGLVEDVLAGARRDFVLHGQSREHDLDIGAERVVFGTGGAAPYILDFETGAYRETALVDLYDIARLVDRLDNVHFYWRSVVARDMPTARDLDINTAYACMQGTAKHIGCSFTKAANLEEAVVMFDTVLGGEGRFRERPFCSISCCHVVPPMRFADDACATLETAVGLGVPVLLIASGQAGATAPAALAGSVAQAVAEALAGLVFANLVDADCKVIFGAWPLVSDLRTGAMSGGSGEQAVLMAASAQMTNFYDIPGGIAAGMADAKLPDAQSGGEKGYTVALAAQAGANMVFECAGMQGSLLGTSLEGYVIDNDLLGAVLRTVRGIEVSDETLSFDVIRDVATGPGHYLGHAQTLEGMERDYVYPEVGDRSPPDDTPEQDNTDVRRRAKERVRAILAANYPGHIGAAADARIRERFNILLARNHMEPDNGRW